MRLLRTPLTLFVASLLCLLVPPAPAQEQQAATSQRFPNSDITGNDIACGNPATMPCVVCGPETAAVISCNGNFKCRAIVYNGTCGILKSAPTPKVERPSSTVVVVTSADADAEVSIAQANNSAGEPAAAGGDRNSTADMGSRG